MTDRPLYVSFLWHMHQPFYKDPETSSYRLPWVRLHGTKDYLDMVDILTEFPDIKQTYNFTPSLLKQITDYTEKRAKDRHLELTLKPALDLDNDEKLFILDNFFLANTDTMIRPFSRYHELLNKRGLYLTKSELVQAVNSFSRNDFLDLQVLFNLCWIDPLFREKDPFLKMLVEKGSNYTEEEKQMLISKQMSILREIIPKYTYIAQKNQIEISASPFYHPILPLLCNTNSAKIALPDIQLPKKPFIHPEDAETQIKMGIEYFEKIFGFRTRGMWPSEGSVSEEVLKIISKQGIQWIGTDEEILSVSIGKQLRDSSRNISKPDILYRPYLYENVSIIFRDHILSDLIGFVYSQWGAKEAAEDFIDRLLHIRSALSEDHPYIVSIILDGENAWEYYQNDGHDFLRYLYEGLSKEERLKTATVSEYLNEYVNNEFLERLHAGSWIYANFSTWIGDEEENTAWEYLAEARDSLETFQILNPHKNLSEAWKAIYIAEGSDWTWWYGDKHMAYSQKDFDELFRMNLACIYKHIGAPVPEHLYVPIHKEDRSIQPITTMKGFIEPKLDGIVTSYYEWYQAAYLDVKKTGGSMHKTESIISGIYYGFNKDTFFLRMDPSMPYAKFPENISLSVNIIKPFHMKITILLKPSLKAELFIKKADIWEKIRDIFDVAAQDIFEMGISFHDLLVQENDEISLFIMILKNNETMERCPWKGYISFAIPSPDFESSLWL